MKKIFLTAVIAAFACAVQVSAKEIRKVVFKVEQMVCNNCGNKVKKSIAFQKGVKDLDIDVKQHVLTVIYDAGKTSIEELKESIGESGYEAKVISDTGVEKKKSQKSPETEKGRL